MKQIQKLCDEEWAATGWQAHDRGGRDYSVWHEAFITAFRIALDLAARHVEGGRGVAVESLAYEIRRLGEENV